MICFVDPLGQFTVTAVGIIFSHMLSVRPSPLFKCSKTKQQTTMVATGETVGLAEWIIDDTCFVLLLKSGDGRTDNTSVWVGLVDQKSSTVSISKTLPGFYSKTFSFWLRHRRNWMKQICISNETNERMKNNFRTTFLLNCLRAYRGLY